LSGDGKLGGIVTPNDGLCHMDEKGVYTHSSIQDYPSVSQINHKVPGFNSYQVLLTQAAYRTIVAFLRSTIRYQGSIPTRVRYRGLLLTARVRCQGSIFTREGGAGVCF
jgi:hypothetical protein